MTLLHKGKRRMDNNDTTYKDNNLSIQPSIQLSAVLLSKTNMNVIGKISFTTNISSSNCGRRSVPAAVPTSLPSTQYRRCGEVIINFIEKAQKRKRVEELWIKFVFV
uniref:Uncharacterized protein n=1 Tax=Cacopsylla melanoneura TaxID=428564 RepID=A0A8D8Z7Z5_9HEMI